MAVPRNLKLQERAKRLRKEMTPEERKLWFLFLKRYPLPIYRQRIIGSFIADFYCAAAGLIIEIDGSQHFEEQGLAYDAERTAFFESLGLKVIRYNNREVKQQFNLVCQDIDQQIKLRQK